MYIFFLTIYYVHIQLPQLHFTRNDDIIALREEGYCFRQGMAYIVGWPNICSLVGTINTSAR